MRQAEEEARFEEAVYAQRRALERTHFEQRETLRQQGARQRAKEEMERAEFDELEAFERDLLAKRQSIECGAWAASGEREHEPHDRYSASRKDCSDERSEVDNGNNERNEDGASSCGDPDECARQAPTAVAEMVHGSSPEHTALRGKLWSEHEAFQRSAFEKMQALKRKQFDRIIALREQLDREKAVSEFEMESLKSLQDIQRKLMERRQLLRVKQFARRIAGIEDAAGSRQGAAGGYGQGSDSMHDGHAEERHSLGSYVSTEADHFPAARPCHLSPCSSCELRESSPPPLR